MTCPSVVSVTYVFNFSSCHSQLYIVQSIYTKRQKSWRLTDTMRSLHTRDDEQIAPKMESTYLQRFHMKTIKSQSQHKSPLNPLFSQLIELIFI